MNLSRRESLLLNTYFFIVVGGVVYFFFFSFALPRYREVNEKIISIENALVKVNDILQAKNILEKKYSYFDSKFSSNKEIKQTVSTEVLQDIKAKVGNAGLSLINIKPLALKEESLYGEFDFKLETEGDLKNCGLFLYNLDDSPYLFTVKFIQISAQSQGEPLKVQLLLSAALAKEQEKND
ncbi:MAG: hypothetical protein HY810_03030 [Candidatus Omnitrophica bacterium]|nr:hypothetical protein [Candidatus Omnitrophota bacterium]